MQSDLFHTWTGNSTRVVTCWMPSWVSTYSTNELRLSISGKSNNTMIHYMQMMLQLMSYSITDVCFCDIASAPFQSRVYGMQEVDIFDFREDLRFEGSRLSGLERSKHLLPNASMEVALMAELLHRGADANQAELVSFCLLVVGYCLIEMSTVKCATESLRVTQCPASLLLGS